MVGFNYFIQMMEVISIGTASLLLLSAPCHHNAFPDPVTFAESLPHERLTSFVGLDAMALIDELP